MNRLRMPGRPSSPALPQGVADALVLLLVGACLSWGLGQPPIRDNNEALYASIALAMSHGGSWLIPHLDGVPYIEKPPLLYWLMALCFKAFGVGAWQARLPDAAAAWLVSLGCLLLGRHLRAPLAGRTAALVCGTAFGWVQISRTILFDPLLSLWWLSALALVMLASLRDRPALMRWAMLPLALGVLSKGPLALGLIGLVGLVQLLLSPAPLSRARLLRLYVDPWSIAIFLLLALPWQLLAAWRQPGFAWFFWVNETINRFLGTRIPDDFHHGPWWYYGPTLLVGIFQWSPLLLSLALRGARGAAADPRERSAIWARNAALTLLLFFSLSSDKGAYYLLPVVPLLAWWGAMRLQFLEDRGQLARWLPLAAAGCAAFGLAALALWLGSIGYRPLHLLVLQSGLPDSMGPALRLLILGLLALSLLAAGLLLAARLDAALLLFGFIGLALSLFTTQLQVAKGPQSSQQRVALYLHDLYPGGVEMYSWQTFEDHDASLWFYGLRPLRVVDSKSSDLWFGCHHGGSASPCVDQAALRRSVASGRPTAIWVARSRLHSFLDSGLACGMQAVDFGYSVVFVHPP